LKARPVNNPLFQVIISSASSAEISLLSGALDNSADLVAWSARVQWGIAIQLDVIGAALLVPRAPYCAPEASGASLKSGTTHL